VEPDGGLALSKRGPRKQRAAEVNRGGVQRASRRLKFKGDTLVELVFGEEVEELGEDGAALVHKVKNRQPVVETPRKVVAELKSKNDRTARICRFYRNEIAVGKISTGQECVQIILLKYIGRKYIDRFLI
jgi:hypothetical protein